jgi:hypothetical protein
MKYSAILLSVAVLTGCASSQHYEAQRPSYCETSSKYTLKDGEQSSSETVVECTDSQIDRLVVKQAGLAKNCGEFLYWTRRGGYDVQRKGISCQKPDGSWEIVNTHTEY